ncbi:MAG TPA: AI-2E family transporter [Intrasporangiaceae bacterium]|nr:AI-2E family transporter [Intrasporangiaceae bacterium]
MSTPEERTGDPIRQAVGAVPRGLIVAGIIAACFVALAAAGWVLLQILDPISPTITGIAFALLLTGLLMPLHRLISRVFTNSHAAAGVTLVTFLVVLIGVIGVAGAQIVTGFGELRDSVFQALQQLETWLREGPLGLDAAGLSEYLEKAQEWLSANTSRLLTGALAAGSAISSFSVALVLALVTTFFFLADGRRIWLWFVGLLPAAVEERVDAAFSNGFHSVRAYVKTQAIVAAVDAVGIGLGALILGLPLVIPMTIIVFIASFIPVIGAVLSGAIVILIAGFAKNLTAALIMLGVVVLVQQLESNLLQPVLMSRAVALHPWGVIVGVAVGGAIYGIIGALFAVPIMALTKVVVLTLRHWGSPEDLPPDVGEVAEAGADRIPDGEGAAVGEESTEPAD